MKTLMASDIPPGLTREAPGTMDQIRDLERRLGFALPPDHVQFFLLTDGLAGLSSSVVFPTAELLEHALDEDLKGLAGRFFAIGSDGSEHLFLRSRDPGDPAVYMVDRGSLDVDDPVILSPDFVGWVRSGCPGEDDRCHVSPNPERVHVYLERPPPRGKADLLVIKRRLALPQGMGELVALCRDTPVPLLENVAYPKVVRIVEELDAATDCLGLRHLSGRKL